MLAYLALTYPYYGEETVVLDLVHAAREGNLDQARALTHAYRSQIDTDCARAKATIDYLEGWLAGEAKVADQKALTIGETANLLALTRDTLRSWERDGLIEVPRNPHNAYQKYDPSQIGCLRVIRVLVNAGYSHMSIFRLMVRLDAGEVVNPREALNTPRSDEDIFHITDSWLTTLDRDVDRCQHIL